ncbi:NAD(P)-binding protein [Meredithblackwellia eburnea MCA 4105]
MANKYNPLYGKKVVVIGGSSGIGYGGAEASLDRGAIVFIGSSSQSKIDQSIKSLLDAYPKGKVFGKAVNVKEESSMKEFFDFVDQTGVKGVDHIIYSSGDNLKLGDLPDLSAEALAASYDVRVFGVLRMAKIVKGLMNKGGSIVLTSGMAAIKPHPGWSLMGSVVGAVISLVSSLAVDFAPIRVNGVVPGAIVTPLWDTFSPQARQELMDSTKASLPTKTIGMPEDVAQAYLFFMSSAFTTGETVNIDGGWRIA